MAQRILPKGSRNNELERSMTQSRQHIEVPSQGIQVHMPSLRSEGRPQDENEIKG